MKYERHALPLKTGETCTLRSPAPEDAAAMLDYLRQTSGETQNLARYPDEVTLTEQEERDYLRQVLEAPDACMISAWVGGELAGAAGLNPVMRRDKIRHRAEFGISIKKEFWSMGIGSLLLSAVADAARSMGYEQVELEVVSKNGRAAALYERFGFRPYGRRPNGMKYRDGSYDDDILMVLRL